MRGGLLLKLAVESIALYAPVELEIVTPDGITLLAHGTIVQHTPGVAVAVAFQPREVAGLREAISNARRTEDEPGPPRTFEVVEAAAAPAHAPSRASASFPAAEPGSSASRIALEPPGVPPSRPSPGAYSTARRPATRPASFASNPAIPAARAAASPTSASRLPVPPPAHAAPAPAHVAPHAPSAGATATAASAAAEPTEFAESPESGIVAVPAEVAAPAAPAPEAATPPARSAAAHAESTAAQKIQLALTGNRDERTAVLRDVNKSAHVHVLRNPGLQADEVLGIAKMTNVSPDLLLGIANRREWAGRPEIAVALIRNPKIPPVTAVKLLDYVTPDQLRQLAKDPHARPPVQAAARKRVVK